jgi:hypothetical protein
MFPWEVKKEGFRAGEEEAEEEVKIPSDKRRCSGLCTFKVQGQFLWVGCAVRQRCSESC